MQTLMKTRTQADSIYSVIGDAGPLSCDEIATLLGEDPRRGGAWVRRHEDAGYIYRDEFGRFSTSCPWPRAGF